MRCSPASTPRHWLPVHSILSWTADFQSVCDASTALGRYTYRMPARACTTRVGGLVVALGIGAAVTVGWNPALAWADEPGSAGGSTTSSDTQPAATEPKTDDATTTT